MQLGVTQEKLRALGVETLAIVNTPVERARLYFKYRPTRAVLLADPEANTHRAYGLPRIEIISGEAGAGASQWPLKATLDELGTVRVNPTGELAEPLSPFDAVNELNKRDGFQMTEADAQIVATHGTQLGGHFLMDRHGIVRWAHVEAKDRMADLAKFPAEEEILAAARALPR